MKPSENKYSYISQQDYESLAGPDWPPYTVFVCHESVPEFVYDELDVMCPPPKSFDHPSFCVLPFYGHEIPENTVCCQLPGRANVDQIKKQMLARQRPKACQACWNLEDAGIRSDRQLKNQTLDYYLDQSIDSILADCEQGKNFINFYKVDTNNTCNATCVTCGSSDSSSWRDLLIKNNQPAEALWQLKPAELDKKINYQTARCINFRGGEPLLSKANFYILEQLIKSGNTDCFVSFQTNGSIIPSLAQQQLLSKFSNLNFSFSIDGVGPVFEYLRYPLQWSRLLETLSWCKQQNIHVSATYTISNVNVFYYKQTVAWFEANDLEYQCNPVQFPHWFRPSVLPDRIKNQIDFPFTNSGTDSSSYEIFLAKIAQQDKWKGIKIKDYLPELADMLD